MGIPEYEPKIHYGAAAKPLSEHPAHRGSKSGGMPQNAVKVLRICPELIKNEVQMQIADHFCDIGVQMTHCI